MIQKSCGIPALRVVQIDAKILDDEIEKLIDNQLNKIVTSLPIRWSILWQKLTEEIRLGLSAVLWSYRYMKGRLSFSTVLIRKIGNFDRTGRKIEF